MEINAGRMNKKEVKKDINKNGFFLNLNMTVQKNIPTELVSRVPEGATYFEGIASNGDLNRNGYGIRESAWKDAINGYFQNPVILLQHDMDKPIGTALTAQVIPNEGLKVSGYVFDEYTENRFSKGLLRALSTGHYTIEVEFENDETHEVLSEEDFIAKYQPGYSFWTGEIVPPPGWTMYVTKLEWVEFSVVSIGSNRKSLVTKQNAITSYLKNKYERNDGEEAAEPGTPAQEVKPPEEEKKEEPDQKQDDPKPGEEEEKPEEKNTDPEIVPGEKNLENDGETPSASDEQKADPDSSAATPSDPGAETKPSGESHPNSVLNGLSVTEVKQAFETLYLDHQQQQMRIVELTHEVEDLKAQMNTPNRRGVMFSGDGAPAPRGQSLAQIFEKHGVGFRE